MVTNQINLFLLFILNGLLIMNQDNKQFKLEENLLKLMIL